MKKLSYLLAGAIIGAAVTLTTSVYGTEIAGLLGKPVQGESEIVVAGATVGTAVVVDGKSYAPVRTVAELGNFEVDFKEKNIVLSWDSEGLYEQAKALADEDYHIISTYINPRIEELRLMIRVYNQGIRHAQAIINKQANAAEAESQTAELSRLREKLAELEHELDFMRDLRRRLADDSPPPPKWRLFLKGWR